MAQGQIKKPSAKSAPKPSSSEVTKKGLGPAASRKQKLQKQMKMNKKLTSGLTAQTEKMLGEKAGYLEMIGKGRNKSGGVAGKDDGKNKGKGGKKGK